jgi:hypothetical protein
MPKEQVWETPKLTADQRAELVRRAYAAWFKAGGTEMPDSERSAVKVRLGLVYVVLHGAAGVLAVYRVRPDNLALRRMARPPKNLVM